MKYIIETSRGEKTQLARTTHIHSAKSSRCPARTWTESSCSEDLEFLGRLRVVGILVWMHLPRLQRGRSLRAAPCCPARLRLSPRFVPPLSLSLSFSLSPAPVGSGGSKPGAGGRRSGQRRVRPRGARAAVAGSWGRSPFPCAFLAAEPRRAGGARGRRRRGAAASCRAGLLREDRAS